MDTSLYVNLSYQSSLTRQLELISNNLANVNTAAFKGERIMFDDASVKAGQAADVSFVIDRASYTDFNAGPVARTANHLDVAVIGDGWLSVETPDGIQYTRDGRLNISANQELVAIDGSPVLDRQGARILVPQEAQTVDIAQSGAISVMIQGEPLPIEIGQLGLYDFPQPQQLVREEGGRFSSNITPAILETGEVQQFAVENSNINPIKEIVRLMDLSRAFNQVAQASDDIHEQKKDSIGRLSRNN